jgi:hypothetical protein
MLIFCTFTAPLPPKSEPPAPAAQSDYTLRDNPLTRSVTTLDYEGHKFILWDAMNGYRGNVIHHPGCPCLGKNSQ